MNGLAVLQESQLLVVVSNKLNLLCLPTASQKSHTSGYLCLSGQIKLVKVNNQDLISPTVES